MSLTDTPDATHIRYRVRRWGARRASRTHLRARRTLLTVHSKKPPVPRSSRETRITLTAPRILVAALSLAMCTLDSGVSLAAESARSPTMAQMAAPPAGAYKLDKSHASIVLRVSHMGFSTYTTRFSRFDADLTFEPENLPASKVATTIDASSFEMDAAPQMCIDIAKGPQMLDTAQYPQIVFKSQRVRMTGAKSMKISGTLTLHGVTRPIVLTATYNGGYAGMPKMDPRARIGFSAHGSFKRSDFGIAYGIPAAGTTMGVGDSIDFSIEAEFIGPALATPVDQSQ
jgi:polyisoprenoid-binding protein YceI